MREFFQKICNDFRFSIFFGRAGPQHARNEISGSSRSVCCQIFSSVRPLALKKRPKNENRKHLQHVDKTRYKTINIVFSKELRIFGDHHHILYRKLFHIDLLSALYDRKWSCACTYMCVPMYICSFM